jgi:hypothetical protein
MEMRIEIEIKNFENSLKQSQNSKSAKKEDDSILTPALNRLNYYNV